MTQAQKGSLPSNSELLGTWPAILGLAETVSHVVEHTT